MHGIHFHITAHFRSQLERQRVERRLGDAVRCRSGQALLEAATIRRHIDDTTVAGTQHRWEERPAAPQSAEEIDVDRAAPVLARGFENAARRVDGTVVDEDVDVHARTLQSLGTRGRIGLAGQIEHLGTRVQLRCLQRLGGGFDRRGIAPGEDDPKPLGSQLPRHFEADASIGSRDERGPHGPCLSTSSFIWGSA
jgi:hypothetical protein